MYKKIIVLLLIGLFFRLFMIFCLPLRTFDLTIKRYHHAAVNLINGRGYSHFDSAPYQPSFYKPPVYSIFLAGVYRVFGINLNAARVVQAFLDTLACLALFYLANSYFGKGIALTVFVLALFFPLTAVYTNTLNPESLALFFMALTLFLISRAVLTGKLWAFFGAGLSALLMGYSRQEFVPLAGLFGIYLVFEEWRKKGIVKKISVYILGILIIMSPWIARNYMLTGKFIPLSAGNALGMTFWLGALRGTTDDDATFLGFLKENPEINHTYNEWYTKVLFTRTEVEEKNEYDAILFKAGLDIIKKDPWGYIFSGIKRIPRTWINLHADEFIFLDNQNLRLFHPDWRMILYYARNDAKQVFILAFKYLLLAINLFYIFMAIAGLWVTRRKLGMLFFILIPLIYAQAFFFFIHPSPNYTIPYWPCIIFFSGIGLYHVFQPKLCLKNRKSG